MLCTIVSNDFLAEAETIKGLGSGAYSKIFSVTRDSKKYVVKTYKTKKGIAQWTLSEIDTLVKLRNLPEIVPLVGICYDTKTAHIVMEQMDCNLWKYRKNITKDEATECAPELLRVLLRAGSAFEQLGLSHFDINPDNVLVKTVKDGSPKFALTDFNLTRPTYDAFNVESEGIYTHGYQPPEFVAERKWGTYQLSKGDVWSIGMTVLNFILGDRLISGYPPSEFLRKIWKLSTHQGKWEDFKEANEKGIITGTLNLENLDLDKDLTKTLTWLLTLNPDERPSATEAHESIFGKVEPLSECLPADVPRKQPSQEALDTILKYSRGLKLKTSTTIIALEILTRFLGLGCPETDAHVIASLRLAGAYNELYPWTAHGHPEKTEEVVEAEHEIARKLDSCVYHPEVVPVITRVEQSKTSLEDFPPEEYGKPLKEWFS